ncbi:MAG: hypothetical protein Q7K98_07420 [Candidatus Omnitrophota bacterium]|nr:hypothetical protein [Candidatus Omnitrophota bacterium]
MNLKNSIDRAITLIHTPADYEEYVVIKVNPVGESCCCFHHWPQTWKIVNEYIHPCGPLQDEGDVLINTNKGEFVLECHESGPEIVIYLAKATVDLIKSIVDLIITLLKARELEKNNRSGLLKYKITRNYQIKDKSIEEEVIELELPLSDSVIKELNEHIQVTIKKRIISKAKA